MKRLLPIILIVAMAISLVSCSLDDLGGFMGFMSKNVYGIKANMKDVKDATNKIDGAVTEDESGNIVIDLDKAATIIDNIGDISASPQKKEEFQKELSKPVSEEKGAEVKVALQTSIGTVIADLPTSGDEKAKEVIDMVKDVLENAKASISDNPTKADLATVAVINDLANLAKDIADDPTLINDPDNAVAVADRGLSALNTLKVVSEVAGVNLLEGIDFSAMLSDMGKSRDGDDDDLQKYFAMAAKNVAKLVSLITKDGSFNKPKYEWVLSQSRAIMASYEIMAKPYIDFTDKTDLTRLDGIFTNSKIKRNLTADDFILYFECLMMTTSQEVTGWDNQLKIFVDANYDALMDLGNKAKDIDFDKYSDLTDLAKQAMDKVTDASKSWSKLGTVAVLVAKANWDNFLLDVADVTKFSDLVNKMR